MKHTYLFYIDCIFIKKVIYIRNITFYILFFVSLWSYIINQAASFAYLICMTNPCMYIDGKTLYAHFCLLFIQ
jgi:hypothetical protein